MSLTGTADGFAESHGFKSAGSRAADLGLLSASNFRVFAVSIFLFFGFAISVF
jgi:hypothetical protein